MYSYIASAHSPSGSGCGRGGGGGGGGDALVSLCGDDTADGTRLGGGAKLFLICGSAAGTGAATGGGTAVLFAVPWRIDRYMFLPEVMSTSPNFCLILTEDEDEYLGDYAAREALCFGLKEVELEVPGLQESKLTTAFAGRKSDR